MKLTPLDPFVKLTPMPLPAFVLVLALAVRASASDVSSLLERDTWLFSQEERAQLNAVEAARFNVVILNLIATATGNLPTGVLMDFQVVDLDADGTSEIIAAVDVSGRGLLRDIAVVSRKDGAYRYDTIPAYGGVIDLWESDGKQFLVGAQPAYELSRTDPLITYPLLYAWTGVKCEEVSERARSYYEVTFLPLFNASLEKAMEQDPAESHDDKRRTVLRMVALSRSVIKVNSLFEQPLVSKDQVAAVKDMLDGFKLQTEEDPGGVISPLLRNAKVEIMSELSRLNNSRDKTAPNARR
ncbi:MAG: hypothetical protein GX803_06315 [Lentisphaerae bacterium]|jgi:hypothetical protein|nr:hypothetical protein [Lentisphaerota bacterium]